MKSCVIIAPDWGNSWIPIYRRILSENQFDVRVVPPDKYNNAPVDVALHMWATPDMYYEKSGVNIVFMRRYELYTDWIDTLPLDKIDHMVFCNTWIKAVAEAMLKEKGASVKTHLIYNAVDLSKWTFKERSRGSKIGMACHVHQKKNIQMALQILAELPEYYELHIAGEVQDACLANYLMSLSSKINRKIFFYNHIQRELLDRWWEDKNYVLSTSISEGNPNNVLEAMAKGIKPIVHAWPGAEDQFDTFSTVNEAIEQIFSGYDSQKYLDTIKTKHSTENYLKVLNLTERSKDNG